VSDPTLPDAPPPCECTALRALLAEALAHVEASAVLGYLNRDEEAQTEADDLTARIERALETT
jgi:hypothetical protein